MHLSSRFAVALSLVFVAACSANVAVDDKQAPTDDQKPAPTDDQKPASGSDSAHSECESTYIGGIYSDTPGYQPFACSLPDPCGAAQYAKQSYPNEGSPATEGFADVAVARCILQKLRDREPVSVGYSVSTDGGFSVDSETIFILDKEHAASNSASAVDLAASKRTRYHEILKPASYFDACLALTDHAKLLDCIVNWSDGCATGLELTCPGK